MESYEHLSIKRFTVEQPRRRSGGGGSLVKRTDVSGHAQKIRNQCNNIEESETYRSVNAFDPNLLVKIKAQDGQLNDDSFKSIGARLISEEDSGCLIVFFDENAKKEFFDRLSKYSNGMEGPGVNATLFHAIDSFELWERGDRESLEIKQSNLFFDKEKALFDVELWPFDSLLRNKESFDIISKIIIDEGGEVVDSFVTDNLVLLKLLLCKKSYEVLVNVKYVRFVSLPPKLVAEFHDNFRDGSDVEDIISPPENAAIVGVLDTGVMPSHPLLQSCIKESKSFVSGEDDIDGNGHGTAVAGFCAHGCVVDGAKGPVVQHEVNIVSGKVLDSNAEYSRKLIANQVTEAVKYFYSKYSCRIFNLSFGDRMSPYDGKHVRGLAVVLDKISKELDVLFVVSAGNLRHEDNPCDWKREYPRYLMQPVSKIIDPATSINSITVGSISREDKTFNSFRSEKSVEQVAIAGKDEPSPFTRSGFGAGGAIKPDFVEYGGNYYIDKYYSNGTIPLPGDAILSEVVLNKDYHNGYYSKNNGTSFAAPRIAHLAALIMNEYEKISANKVRAILGASSSIPNMSEEFYERASFNSKTDVFSLVGYGLPNKNKALRSTDNSVVMISEDTIKVDEHQFYEVPIPDSFFMSGRRAERRIIISLAYSSRVRSTRLSYKEVRIGFKVVEAESMDEVKEVFVHKSEKENVSETPGFFPSSQLRRKGTLQVAEKKYSIFNGRNKLKNNKSKLFIVVTCQNEGWGEFLSEDYALAIRMEDTYTEGVSLYKECKNIIRSRTDLREKVRLSNRV
ncbi:S8 family peptidase [Halomonas sp. DP5N14-9]|uniref:S8 family peptidase n=1 Tax=Halomonas sp. DP5N14-9 TaxID=2859075 RepID=UPI001C98E739|nr:S8 family peptidase [Halomonas sp. DP5N14-9]MBY5940403.1 S8 family peptidase [Halomonas sp. DP5N14-9]